MQVAALMGTLRTSRIVSQQFWFHSSKDGLGCHRNLMMPGSHPLILLPLHAGVTGFSPCWLDLVTFGPSHSIYTHWILFSGQA